MTSAWTTNSSIGGHRMHPLATTGDLGLQKLAAAGDLEQHSG